MKKRRRKKRAQRDVDTITRRKRPLLSLRPKIKSQLRKKPIIFQEDRRTYHPDGRFREAETIFGTKAEIIVKKEPLKSKVPSKLQFRSPLIVNICRKRKKRRQVLFKLRRIGKGRSGPKRRRRTLYSDVRC